MKKILQLGVLSVFICGLVACGKHDPQHHALRKYITHTNSRNSGQIAALPAFKPLAKYEYVQDEAKRNPFKAYAHRNFAGIQSAPNINWVREPLEAFPLDSLKMVGVMNSNNRIWALIEAPDGNVYQIEKNGHIGKDYGIITKISNQEMELLETVKVAGRWQKVASKITIDSEQARG